MLNIIGLRYVGLSLLAIFCSVPAISQDSLVLSDRKTDLSLQFGGGTFRNAHYSLTELKQLNPDSKILNAMSGAGINYFGNELSAHSHINLSIGSYSTHPGWLNSRHLAGWRIGVNFMQCRLLNYDSYSNESTRIDTLFDQRGSMTAFRDSVNSYDRTVKIESSIISAEAAYIVRFNSTRRWSYYIGFGLNLGGTVRNEMELKEDAYHTRQTYDVSTGQEYSSAGLYSYQTTSELKKIGIGYQVSGFIPFGIDFKITRKLRGFDFLHLFFEGRTGISLINIPGLRTSTGTNTTFSIGFRSVLK